VAKQICESEAGDLEVTLNAFSDKSLATLNAAPSAEGLALLNGHKF